MLKSFDHIVLATRDEGKCLDFYTRALGMTVERYGENRIALRFGDCKINVHQPGMQASLVATIPTPGSLDFCILAAVPLDQVIARLNAEGVTIIAGPGIRAGARGPIRSVYMRDPDGNLVEVSEMV